MFLHRYRTLFPAGFALLAYLALSLTAVAHGHADLYGAPGLHAAQSGAANSCRLCDWQLTTTPLLGDAVKATTAPVHAAAAIFPVAVHHSAPILPHSPRAPPPA